jgi:hypothetical protein
MIHGLVPLLLIVVHFPCLASLLLVMVHYLHLAQLMFIVICERTLHYYFVIPHHFEVLISLSFVLLLLVVVCHPLLYIVDIFLLR